VKKEYTRLFIDAFLLGLIGVISAQIFTFLVDHAHNLFLGKIVHYKPGLPREAYNYWLIPLVTTLGGLLSGFLVYTFAPEAEGHGTDAAVKAFHYTEGQIRPRVPFVKLLASAITIGSGGSAGREGPVVQISAGIASIYATLAKRSVPERRLLLLVGMSAGLGAVFRSPIGAAMFSVGILYSEVDIEAHAVLFSLLASVTAYALNGMLVSWEPLFHFPPNIAITNLYQYLLFASLGVFAGVIATFLPSIFYHTRDFFKELALPNVFKPALGGLLLGLMALILPQVLGGGYYWIQAAIDGRLDVGLMFILIFAKMIALALTVGSGGSGGVFAPSLFVGAMLGGSMAHLFQQSPAPYVVIGMAAVFGAAARVPLATLFMVIEMTGAFHLLGATALSVTLSYVVHRFLSSGFKYQSLYEGQVPTKFQSPAHRGEFFQDILLGVRVKDIFDPKGKKWDVLPENMSFEDFVKFFHQTEQHYFPVVDSKGRLVGIFSINDVRPFLTDQNLWKLLILKDIARQDVITTTPSEDIHSALQKFTIRNIDQLPVVADDDPHKFLGMLSRREVIRYYNQRLAELNKEKSPISI